MEAIMTARPAAVKGIYLKRVTLTSTMGPGVRVDINTASTLKAA
jgi:large subunit ribosomal protein L1